MLSAIAAFGKVADLIGGIFNFYKNKKSGELEKENEFLKEKIKQMEIENDKLKKIIALKSNININDSDVYGLWEQDSKSK